MLPTSGKKYLMQASLLKQPTRGGELGGKRVTLGPPRADMSAESLPAVCSPIRQGNHKVWVIPLKECVEPEICVRILPHEEGKAPLVSVRELLEFLNRQWYLLLIS